MDIYIRKEEESEYFETEYMTKKAFWNLHVPGCNEHLLVHKLRKSKKFIPQLSRVAVLSGKVVGTIMYSNAKVIDGEKSVDVLTFGPLCVEPKEQNKGIGGLLLEKTMDLARQAGYKAIIIYGEPGYYPKHGFKRCSEFNITTPDENNFDAFMAIELVKDGLNGVKGKFYEPNVYDELPDEEVEIFDKKFPHMDKLRLPGQWGYTEDEN